MTQPLDLMPNHPLVDSVTGLRTILDQAAEVSELSLSDAEVSDLLVQVHSAVGQLEGLRLRLINQVDTRELATRDGAASTATWLRGKLLVDPTKASRLVRLARALAGEFAATATALARGRLSRAHAEAIAASVAALPVRLGNRLRREAETTLLEMATRFDPRELRRLGRHILHVVDPDLADRLLADKLAREERKAKDRNALHLTPTGEGGARLGGSLDAESEAIVKAALDPLATPVKGADGRDARSHAQRMGDALVELCRRALTQGDLPDNGGDRPTVVVTIDFEALQRRLNAGYLDTGEPLSPNAIRRIACDAAILPTVLGSTSQPLDLGRRNRLFGGSLRRALVLRDRGCAFPGCDRPPVWCMAHHIIHWADGGPTCLSNGVLLCGHHHIVIHKGDWKVHIGPDGHPYFIPPPWIDPRQQPQRNTRIDLAA